MPRMLSAFLGPLTWAALVVCVGVIDGTMAELWRWFGIGDPEGSWLRPGVPLPAFALVDSRHCQVAPGVFQSGAGTISEQATLAWLLHASRRAASYCTT